MGNRWSEYGGDITSSFKYVEIKPDGSLGWVPSIGQSIDFLIGRTESLCDGGGITKYIQTSKTYAIGIDCPNINGLCRDSEKKIFLSSKIKSVIGQLMNKTEFLDDLEKLCSKGSDLIGANAGQYWGDMPVRYLSDALMAEGYLIETPPTYSQIGGRHRYQTYGVRIFRDKKRRCFNYEPKGATNSLFFWSRFIPVPLSH